MCGMNSLNDVTVFLESNACVLDVQCACMSQAGEEGEDMRNSIFSCSAM